MRQIDWHPSSDPAMERSRETRRGGSATAPRRPRSSGFKDAPVGEDGDDILDDVQNPRLRERAKKDASSVTAVQGIPSSSLGSVSRTKRKRQGVQEVQGQARSSTVDDIDAITEDTDMGPSEEDDDLPPPPIPRRSGKLRPQGKFLDDVSADLPAIPRKARTAILKRPQESSSPVLDVSSQQVSIAVARNPASSSAPSSSSVASLKPGRRTKLSNSKPRAGKVPKVSSPAIISDQEVEVAEALFDLARMCTTNQLTSSVKGLVIDLKHEPVADTKSESELMADLEASLELKASAEDYTAWSSPHPPSAPVAVAKFSSPPCAQIPNVVLSASLSPCSPLMSTVPFHTAPLLAVPVLMDPLFASSQSPPVAPLPPAEAPKRKRPRIRTRLDDAPCASQLCPPGNLTTVISFSGPSSPHQRSELEQMGVSSPHITDTIFVKQVSSRPISVVDLATVAPSGTSSALRPMELGPEASLLRNNSLEKKTDLFLTIVDVSGLPAPLEKRQTPPEERHSLGSVSSAAWTPDNVVSPNSMPRNETLSESEFVKRCPKFQSSADNGGQFNNLDIDLMAAPLTKSALSSVSESIMAFSRTTTKDLQEQGRVASPMTTVTEPSKMDTVECMDAECEGEIRRHRELEPEHGRWGENEINSEAKEQERIELEKHSPHRPGKAPKSESRTPKIDLDASANSASIPIPSSAASPLGVGSLTASISGSMSTPPVSPGMATWPLSLAPIGYYGAAASVGSWPGAASIGGTASVDENSKPAVQHQYVIQAHQPQPWKRCASHVYIAHFIDLQQQMNRHPFIQAAYQNSASLYGAKPYNLNIPLPSAEVLLGSCREGHLIGGLCGGSGASVISSVGSGPGLAIAIASGSESSIGGATLSVNVQFKDGGCMESLSRKQTIQQQPFQLSPNLPIQVGSGFGFPVPQDGAAGEALVSSASGSGVFLAENSGSVVSLSSGLSTGSTALTDPGAGPSNGLVLSNQAHYLQTVMQHTGFPFSFQAAAHFSNGFSGPLGHVGHQQQVTQFFSSPSCTPHLVHPPAYAQERVQQSSILSAGLASVQKPTLPQQVINFPLSYPQLQQPSFVPPSEFPSHAQQHMQGFALGHLQQPVEREGQNGAEVNSSEGKYPVAQQTVQGQGKVSVSSGNSASSLFLGGGLQSLPPEDFTLIAGLGAKHSKSRHGQMAILQQQQVSPQHHNSGPAFKGGDLQPSGVSMAVMNRGLGPGPVGRAPVAAVMAHGQALFQDHSRAPAHHQQAQHTHTGQQQQRPAQMLVVTSGASIVEDLKTAVDGNSFPISRSGKEMPEDKRVVGKRGMVSSSNPSREEIYSPAPPVQVSSGGLSTHGVSGNVGPMLNLMTPTSSAPGGSQQPGHTASGNQNSKQVIMSRSKFLAGSCMGTSSSSSQSQLSFTERGPLGSSLSNKGQGPVLSFLVPNTSQAQRHSQAHQPPQVRLSSRNLMGSSPTLLGTASQVVLGTAIAKTQHGSQHEPFRQQVTVSTSTSPLSRLPASNAGTPPINICIPSNPMPAGVKTAPAGSAKSNSSGKGSFSLSYKPLSGLSSKRLVPPSGLLVGPLSGQGSLQNLASKAGSPQQGQNHHHSQQLLQPQQGDHSQHPLSQQHHNPNQNHARGSQPHTQTTSPLASTLQQQFHKQTHCNTQLFRQVHSKSTQPQTHNLHHVFPPNVAFHQQQQPTGSPLHPHPQLQSSQQMHQPATSLSSQQQQQQEQKQHQLLSVQVGPRLFSGPSVNGSLALGPPTLTLGTANNGNSTSSALSDSLLGTHGSRPIVATNNNVTSSSGILPSNSASSHRSHCGGTLFSHAQFVSSVTCSQQNSSSPCNSPVPQYLQAGCTAASVEQKISADGNAHEQQVNAVRLLSGSSPARVPQVILSGMQTLSTRPTTGGSSIGNQTGCQFTGNNYAGIGSGGLILSVAPPTSTCSNFTSDTPCTNGSGKSGVHTSTVHLDTERTPLFGGSSPGMSQAAASQLYAGSIHQPSPLVETSTTSDDAQSGQHGTHGQS